MGNEGAASMLCFSRGARFYHFLIPGLITAGEHSKSDAQQRLTTPVPTGYAVHPALLRLSGHHLVTKDLVLF